jgi:catechol-2,3-dioxygenase
MSLPMIGTNRTDDAESAVTDFVAGRLSRRQLVARLMALGAAAAGAGRALAQEGAGSPTFTATGVDHIALNVTDIARSRDWYVKHLGLRVMSDGPTSCFLSAGDGFLALFKADAPGMHHYSFAIPRYNQQDAAERLRAAGLTPKLRGTRIYFDDPDGIEVQVSRGEGGM